MKRIVFASLITLIVFGAAFGGPVDAGPASTAPAQVAGPPAGQVIPGQYIVVFRNNVDAEGYGRALEQLYGFIRGNVYTKVLKGFSAQLPDAIVNILRNDPYVLTVEPDTIVTRLIRSLPPASCAHRTTRTRLRKRSTKTVAT